MSGVKLPDSWVSDMGSALQARPLPEGAQFSVVVNITGTSDGDQSAAWAVDGGWLKPSESIESPDLVVTAAAKDAALIVAGNTPFPVGFMRGKVKISGDPASALVMLKASAKG